MRRELRERYERLLRERIPRDQIVSVKEILSRFARCAKEPIWRERIVIVGCNEVSEVTLRVLRRPGLRPRAYAGFVTTFDKKRIAHTWVEVDDYVIETNPSQILGIPYELTPIMWEPRAGWEEKTRPKMREPYENGVLLLTPSGENFYNSLVEEIIRCMGFAAVGEDDPIEKIEDLHVSRRLTFVKIS